MPQGEVKRYMQAEQDQRLYIWAIFIKVLDVEKACQLDAAAREKEAVVSRLGMHHHIDGG